MLSVAVAGFVTGFTDDVLDWSGSTPRWAGWSGCSPAFGFGANILLFFTLSSCSRARTRRPLAVVRRAARGRRLRGAQAVSFLLLA